MSYIWCGFLKLDYMKLDTGFIAQLPLILLVENTVEENILNRLVKPGYFP